MVSSYSANILALCSSGICVLEGASKRIDTGAVFMCICLLQLLQLIYYHGVSLL